MMTSSRNIRTGFSFFLALALVLFSLQPVLGQYTTTESMDLKELRSLRADIVFNAGTIKLSTHDQADADLHFFYSRDAWKPDILLDQQTASGKLSIRQPKQEMLNMLSDEENEWNIKLPRKLPGDLKVRMGAGEGRFDLEGAKLNRFELLAGAGDYDVNLADTDVSELEISAGVGSLSLDLTGRRRTNLVANINGGIGDLKLLLPADTGVRIKVNGLGSIDRSGFSKQDGYYVNEAYGKTKYSLDITVNGGLGSVEMALDDWSN